jgi:hypothetical protein
MSPETAAFSPGGSAGQALEAAARQARCAVICGVPGMGKSLLLRELGRIAAELGRTVHRLQWDVARQSFEWADILARYPEIEGSTHPVIRRAAGLWVRYAVSRWWENHPQEQHLLLIEAPLVGGRFIELARQEQDTAETPLASPATSFLVPVPSTEVRAAIQAARVSDTAAPRHARDAASAIPVLVDVLWEEVAGAARALGLPEAAAGPEPSAYSPDLYGALFRQVLRHRHIVEVPVTEIVPEPGSPHEHARQSQELAPEDAEVSSLIGEAEAEGVAQVVSACEAWYRL